MAVPADHDFAKGPWTDGFPATSSCPYGMYQETGCLTSKNNLPCTDQGNRDALLALMAGLAIGYVIRGYT